jgi:hypothetical protein
MHAVLLSYHIENESIIRQVPDSTRDRQTSKRERQLPKLNVAGSIRSPASYNQQVTGKGYSKKNLKTPLMQSLTVIRPDLGLPSTQAFKMERQSRPR